VPGWSDQLSEQLDQRRRDDLYRRLSACDRSGRIIQRQGRRLINFAGNDYLGLATDPRLAEAVGRAAGAHGVGSGASRLITGHLDLHQRLDQRFAAFKHAEAALILPTGYMANLAAVTAMLGPDDLICLDQRNHASLIDAARLSGATVRSFGHRQYDKLDRLLSRATVNRKPPRRRMILSDSVFSMDGDCADLRALVELRDRHEAILMIDEAHATGLLGQTGAGLAEHEGLAGAIDVSVSTASKAMGSLGGIVTGSRLVIDTLINFARPAIYTTAPPPTQLAGIDAALDVIATQHDRRDRLTTLSARLRDRLEASGWPVPPTHGPPTPIVPVITGSPASAVRAAQRLEEAGLLAPAVRPPTVPPGSSRIRISLRCDHTDADIEQLIEALASVGPPR
jgi:8-amino-7-oxononanoate synthase